MQSSPAGCAGLAWAMAFGLAREGCRVLAVGHIGATVSQNPRSLMLFKKKLALASLCFLLIVPKASLANDQLSHGIYCLEVMKGFIEYWDISTKEIDRSLAGTQLSPKQRKDIIDAERRASQELTDRFNRLRLYVVTKMLNMDLDDTVAATVAQKRGQMDAQRCEAEMQQQNNSLCSSSCNRQHCATGDASCAVQCFQQCGLLTCSRI